MNRMYNAIVNFNKKVTRENAEDQKKKKHKYEYDSDEDTEGGTWEHKQRMQEMKETSGKWIIHPRLSGSRCTLKQRMQEMKEAGDKGIVHPKVSDCCM